MSVPLEAKSPSLASIHLPTAQVALSRIGYIPQASALYRELTVNDHIDLIGTLRPTFDPRIARARLDDLGINTELLVAHLSGGQQAQIALALVLAAHAEILLLDEPLAALDPLARREFLYVLDAGVRASGATVVLSSHVVTDLAQVADHLVILGDGHKLLDATIGAAVASHRIVVAETAPTDVRTVASFLGLGEVLTLVEITEATTSFGQLREATLEELMLGYLAIGRTGMVDRLMARGVAT